MVSRLIRNQLPSDGLRVRAPCPPLNYGKAAGDFARRLFSYASSPVSDQSHGCRNGECQQQCVECSLRDFLDDPPPQK